MREIVNNVKVSIFTEKGTNFRTTFFSVPKKFHVLRNVFGKFEKWKCDFFLETKVNCNVQLYCTYGKKKISKIFTRWFLELLPSSLAPTVQSLAARGNNNAAWIQAKNELSYSGVYLSQKSCCKNTEFIHSASNKSSKLSFYSLDLALFMKFWLSIKILSSNTFYQCIIGFLKSQIPITYFWICKVWKDNVRNELGCVILSENRISDRTILS